jgi:hypothetical protein
MALMSAAGITYAKGNGHSVMGAFRGEFFYEQFTNSTQYAG